MRGEQLSGSHKIKKLGLYNTCAQKSNVRSKIMTNSTVVHHYMLLQLCSLIPDIIYLVSFCRVSTLLANRD